MFNFMTVVLFDHEPDISEVSDRLEKYSYDVRMPVYEDYCNCFVDDAIRRADVEICYDNRLINISKQFSEGNIGHRDYCNLLHNLYRDRRDAFYRTILDAKCKGTCCPLCDGNGVIFTDKNRIAKFREWEIGGRFSGVYGEDVFSVRGFSFRGKKLPQSLLTCNDIWTENKDDLYSMGSGFYRNSYFVSDWEDFLEDRLVELVKIDGFAVVIDCSI